MLTSVKKQSGLPFGQPWKNLRVLVAAGLISINGSGCPNGERVLNPNNENQNGNQDNKIKDGRYYQFNTFLKNFLQISPSLHNELGSVYWQDEQKKGSIFVQND